MVTTTQLTPMNSFFLNAYDRGVKLIFTMGHISLQLPSKG